MISDLNIFRRAWLLMRTYGPEHAAAIAAERVEEVRAEGDAKAIAVRQRIADAVRELTREKMHVGEKVH